MVRIWGATLNGALMMARKFKNTYMEIENEEEKLNLILLLSILFSTHNEDLARKSAKVLGIEQSAGLSIGETIFCNVYKERDPILWKRKFSEFEDNFEYKTDISDWKTLNNIIPRSMSNRAMALYREPRGTYITNIYVVREAEGDIRLIGVNNCSTAFLADEAPFNGDMPFYFTDSTHFVSPRFYINKMADLIEFIMKEVGYPPVRILKSVVFPNIGAEKINEIHDEDEEEYLCLENDGVEFVTEIRKHKDYCLYPQNLRHHCDSNLLDRFETKLSRMSAMVLKGASYLFRYMKDENILAKYNSEDLLFITDTSGLFE